MNIFEVIGMAWVILTSALATVAIFGFAYRGLRTMMSDAEWRAMWKEQR